MDFLISSKVKKAIGEVVECVSIFHEQAPYDQKSAVAGEALAMQVVRANSVPIGLVGIG